MCVVPNRDRAGYCRTGRKRLFSFCRFGGSVHSSLSAFWNSAWKNKEELVGRVVIGFSVADLQTVDLYAEMIASGATGLSRRSMRSGARYAILEDPDGVAIGLMSPSDPAMRMQPAID